MSNKINNINSLIQADKENAYLKDFNRIKSGKSFDIHFKNYKESYVKDMIEYFESTSEYEKSGYLNLKLNGFREHK